MAADSVPSRPPESTRERLIDLLRRAPRTAAEIATQLGLTYNGVRSQLAALQRDGLVQAQGMKPGATRPAVIYELAPGVESTLSKAYMPFASHLVQVLAGKLPEPELDAIMREVGKSLASDLDRPRGTLPERVEAASDLLKELGAPNELERENGLLRIRGFGCLLAEVAHGRDHVCHAMETLLSELLDHPVAECCDRRGKPRCCFEIKA